MTELDVSQIIDAVKTCIDTVSNVLILVLTPIIMVGYRKIQKSIRRLKLLFRRGYHKALADWESDMSRQVIKSIGFFIDGIDASPYCRTDQILYVSIVNGVVGPGRLHSMFVSVLVEDNSISRCNKKIKTVQRVPYSVLSNWFSSLEEAGIVKIPNLEESEYAELPIFETAKSSMAVPVYTRDKCLAGAIIFNFFDPNYNFSESNDQNEEQLLKIKTFVESQYIQMAMARKDWIAKNS